jgi:hypothetical protein
MTDPIFGQLAIVNKQAKEDPTMHKHTPSLLPTLS